MNTQVSLAQLKPGQRGIVQGFSGQESDRYRLMEMGLLPGTEIRFIRRAPLGDPLEVELRGFHLSLREKEAALIGISLIG